MEATAGKTGREHPLSLGALAGENLTLGEDPVAASLEPGGHVCTVDSGWIEAKEIRAGRSWP